MKLKYMHPMLTEQPALVQVYIDTGEKFVWEKTTNREGRRRKGKGFKRRMGKGSERGKEQELKWFEKRIGIGKGEIREDGKKGIGEKEESRDWREGQEKGMEKRKEMEIEEKNGKRDWR